MSQENAELVRRATDAFNRRDLEASLELADADVELIPRAVAMEGGDHYHGHEGIRRWWTDLLGIFPDFKIELLEVRGLGDVTFTAARLRGHGAGSDTPAQEDIWQVARWQKGKCVWWRTFSNRSEALEAAGLEA